MATKKKETGTATAPAAAKEKKQETVQVSPLSDPQGEVQTKPAVNPKPTTPPKPAAPKQESAASVLEKVGKSAIERHGFKEVFVTSDGQAFQLQSDAQHHAADLKDKNIKKVSK